MGKLTGKTALITGASRGIGEGIVKIFAKHGARLILLDVSPEAKTLAEELKSQGYPCAAVQADVRDAAQVAAAVAEGTQQMGEIDILVNNAGVCRLGNFLEMSDADRDFHIDINIKGVWNVTKAVLPGMVKRGDGRIVIMSSVTGDMVADPGETATPFPKQHWWDLPSPLLWNSPVPASVSTPSVRVMCVLPWLRALPVSQILRIRNPF